MDNRVRVPMPGERCPRHHGMVKRGPRANPCLLCRPDLVPARFGGSAITCRKDAAIVAARLPGRPR